MTLRDPLIGNQIKELTYDEFFNNSDYRFNVLRFFPFTKGGNILHVGSQQGILTTFLVQIGKVDCLNFDYEENNVNANRNHSVKIYTDLNLLIKNHKLFYDYIVIEGYLDKVENKKDFLTSLLSCLNKTGSMLILANNKLAFSQFAGDIEKGDHVYLKNLTSKNYLYTKKEWDNLLSQFDYSYQFYYPYPNYSFTDSIFSKSPNRGEKIIKSVPNNSIRFSCFNDANVFDEIIRCGYFTDFANSFLILINSKCDIEYSKISSERKPQYQVYTNIIHRGKEKRVEKVAIHDIGKQHLKRMYEYYNKVVSTQSEKNISYCPVHLLEDRIVFDYIDGVCVEKIIEDCVRDDNLHSINTYVNLVYHILDLEEECKFSPDEDFYTIFGKNDYSILREQPCVRNANIDLIFNNILINEKVNIIDYEWILYCTIPKSYIVYRSILSSYGMSLLEPEKLQNILNSYGITKEFQEIYYKMELGFQKYVSGFTLNDYKNILNEFSVNCDMYKGKIVDVHFIQGKKDKTLYTENRESFDLISQIDESSDVVIHLDKKAIFKLETITLEDIETHNFETNCSLQVNNDYFFLDRPEIFIKNNGAKNIRIKGIIYYYDDDCIDNIVELIQTNNALQIRLDRLRKFWFNRKIDKGG